MSFLFRPARRSGLIFHSLAAILVAGGSVAAFWFAFRQPIGFLFVLFILLGLLLFFPLPLLLYRGYALLNARYIIERDGLRLRWGLRAEDIPLPEIEWVRPAADLAFQLPVPRLSMPGAVTGMLNVPDLGTVEYLASDRAAILLLATPHRVYAISPVDPVAFVRAFRDATEMGSLTPIDSFSARPAAFLRGVWGNPAARWLLAAGAIFVTALFILVTLLIPGLNQVSLGFDPTGQPAEPGQPGQLLLLPILGVLTFITDLIGGLFFYRWEEQRPVAYLLWAGAIITPVLLLVAVLLLT